MKKMIFYLSAVPLTLLMLSSCKATPGTGYSGADLTGQVEITRDKQTKEAFITVRTEGAWKAYAGPINNIDMKKEVAGADGPGTYKLDVSDENHSYVQFVSGNNRAILAERRLPMEGGYNFRDLGGFRTEEGYYTAWGKIFRSDDLYNLTEGDLEYLAGIPIVSVVDFRAQSEIDAAPDKLPSGAARYQLSISPGDMSQAASIAEYSAEDMAEFMKELNVMLVTDSSSVAQYRELFRLLQDEANAPLMFHCSAGKDRTGMGAALILSALGVDEAAIIEDYELSNIYLGDKYSSIIETYPNLKPLMTVDREYLQAGLGRIKADHGSVENFLRGELNVDIENFRRMYLY